MGDMQQVACHPYPSFPRFLGLVAVLTAGIAAGCAGDSGGPDAGSPAATLQDVQDLFGARCAGSSCHVGFAGEPGGAMDLGPDALCASLIDVAAVEVPALRRVVPGSPDESYLLCKLTPGCADLPDRATLMPPGFPDGLPAAERDLVTRWIMAGAPGCQAPGQDVTPPAFAGVTTATPLAQAVRLQWAPATDDVTAPADVVYLVYQAPESGAQDFGQPVLETAAGAAQATVTGLDIDTAYYFVVRARDAAGNVDTNTAEVRATTLAIADSTSPTFAGLASATAIGTTAVELAWSPATDDSAPSDAIRYHVYVSESAGGQDFTAPALTTPAGATGALVTGLGAGTRYFFVVRAEDTAGNQDVNTAEVQATTRAAVSFSQDIEPLLNDTCARNGCHAGVNPAEDLDLRTGRAHAALVDVAAVQCSDGRARVDPSNPDGSYLIDKLTGVDLCAGTIMPKGSPLTPAEIQLIRDWIAAGALPE